jgi:hypothetical protein
MSLNLDKLDRARNSAPNNEDHAPKYDYFGDNQHNSVAVQTSPHPSAAPSAISRSLSGLADEIAAFSQAVDKFKEERHSLTESLVSTIQHVQQSDPPPERPAAIDVPFTRILLIEEECIRYVNSRGPLRLRFIIL